MQSRLHAGKAAKSSREKGKRSHYERVHDDSAGGSSGGAAAAILSSACYAAAEDDHLGWQLGDAPFDPMYTVRRREREANATGKDSFLKKLKRRIENTAEDTPANEATATTATTTSAPAAPAPAPAAARMFGFGMMGSAPAAEPTPGDHGKLKESKKDKKSKKPKKDKSSAA